VGSAAGAVVGSAAGAVVGWAVVPPPQAARIIAKSAIRASNEKDRFMLLCSLA
jgi:hypothetical protein